MTSPTVLFALVYTIAEETTFPFSIGLGFLSNAHNDHKPVIELVGLHMTYSDYGIKRHEARLIFSVYSQVNCPFIFVLTDADSLDLGRK